MGDVRNTVDVRGRTGRRNGPYCVRLVAASIGLDTATMSEVVNDIILTKQ